MRPSGASCRECATACQWRKLLDVRSGGETAPGASTARALAVRETNSQANEVAITFWILELWREPVIPVRVRGVSCDSRAALPQRLPLLRAARITCGASCTQLCCASVQEAGAAWRDTWPVGQGANIELVRPNDH